MTPTKLKTMFPNASKAFLQANEAHIEHHDHPRKPQTPKLEPDPGHAPHGEAPTKTRHTTRHFVRVTATRTRLCDEDNLCCKYLVDALRYAGVIHEDSPDQTEIQVTQRKAAKGEAEATRIEVFFYDAEKTV